jgi:spermidine synthase
MSLLSYLFPQEIFRGSSAYSTDIRVIEDSGSLRLLVDGIEQSGKYIDKILKRAIDACEFPSSSKIETMLLLGVGGGSLIRFFRKPFPDIAIDAVDIDPVIIQVAQKYFGLVTAKDLHIQNGDALRFVGETAKKNHRKYDLIVVDLYIGRSIPDFVWDREFLEQIHALLRPCGLVFINVVHDGKYEERVKKLRRTLQNLFSKVQEIPVDYNTFFFVTI